MRGWTGDGRLWRRGPGEVFIYRDWDPYCSRNKTMELRFRCSQESSRRARTAALALNILNPGRAMHDVTVADTL